MIGIKFPMVLTITVAVEKKKKKERGFSSIQPVLLMMLWL